MHCVARLFIQGGVSKCCTRRSRASCAKTVSKLHLLGGRELLFERKQLPQSDVNTRNLREPIETLEKISLLHTQEVTGSSPVAPTIPRFFQHYWGLIAARARTERTFPLAEALPRWRMLVRTYE